jgi:hypothetical protein
MVSNTLQLGKVIGGMILTLLWIGCFLFISPTLIIDWGAGIITNFRFTVILLGLLIIILYHIFYRSNAETTKLSLTAAVTMVWLALILFYPFKALAQDPTTEGDAGAMGFFTLIGGLAVCVLWVRFFSDEIFE